MPDRPRTVWLRGESSQRKPRLSLERIVAAAVSLLDAEGVAGFSMRRLAARLDCGTMSLYAYVDTKDDVFDLAIDAVFAEIELDSPDTETRTTADAWRHYLTRQLVQTRGVLRRHPWILGLMSGRPLLGPNALARSERFYTALSRAGLTGQPLLAAVGALSYFVDGFVAAENVWRSTISDPGEELVLRRDAQAHIDEHAEIYPTLSAQAQLEFCDFDESFALGLTIILDGIEAQLP
ncbi:TetR/AcrR family transcriptional regulator [Nocardia cyriacigeorgica]|uniref:TetR/AcrR family transcriptional regulator n=1 Tax=Nocardia cyriacigeorgica TaxID=135487 RepID=A0A5R8P0I8_9NOCA|nr:TetR/AcrR family transcriptional regulator C-terminal domain-containing protein [Nocardia cyriacigeorgica]TLF81182.1 TetR/AcrR family transcriptional regulator [Nocardia cyriacigeorgica]